MCSDLVVFREKLLFASIKSTLSSLRQLAAEIFRYSVFIFTSFALADRKPCNTRGMVRNLKKTRGNIAHLYSAITSNVLTAAEVSIRG